MIGIASTAYINNIHLFQSFVKMQRDLYVLDDAIVPIVEIERTGMMRSSSSSSSSALIVTQSDDSDDAKKQQWSDVKLAIYMTTHLSQVHLSFLPCWYDAVQRLEIFRYADLILYTPSTLDPVSPDVLQQLPFPSHNIIIKYYNNTGYQNGAIQAMIDPFLMENNNQDQMSWFDNYDWVIRLNPDVLIRNDTWLIQTMMNRSIDAIFHDCHNRILYPSQDHPSTLPKPIPKFHTDFTAFRPSAIQRDLVLSTPVATYKVHQNRSISNAEQHLTKALWNIYQSERFVYVQGGENSVPGRCRIEGIHSPILHVHELVEYCPYYYNATKAGIF